MYPVSFDDIPQTVLAALLDYEGQAGSMSPRTLMGGASPITKHQLAELYAGGFVELPINSAVTPTPLFREVIRTLLNPKTHITFRLWGEDNLCAETSLLFPADLLNGAGVVLNQIGQNYRIAAAVETADILDLIRPVIPAETEQTNQVIFEGHFDIPIAAVLFGLIDLVRQNNGRLFTTSQLYGYLDGQWGLAGFDSLITYIATTGMMPHPPSLKEVGFSLQILLDANIVCENTENEYSLADSLNPMLGLIPETIPGLQWQRVSQAGDGELLCCNRIFLICRDGFILSFSATVQGKVFISNITRDDLINFLLDECMVVFPRSQMNTSVGIKGNSSALARKAELSDKILSCDNCGKRVPANKKFCTHCGGKVTHTVEDVITINESEVVCLTCGKSLKRGVKFCTKCGAPA